MTSTAGNWSRNRACASAWCSRPSSWSPFPFRFPWPSRRRRRPGRGRLGPRPRPRPPRPGTCRRPRRRGLQRRVEQLEEQLVDLQVIIGTLELLAKGAAAPPAGPRGGAWPAAAVNAADAGRLDAIETQIRALAAQLESLQDQVRNLGVRHGAECARRTADARRRRASAPSPSLPSAQQDEIDRLLSPPQEAAGRAPRRTQPPGGGQGEPEVPPQQLYEQAYGYLLQKDYGAAESASTTS